MPNFLKQADRFRAHAAASLANAEAAGDAATRRAHLAVARHFYLLAEPRNQPARWSAGRFDQPRRMTDGTGDAPAHAMVRNGCCARPINGHAAAPPRPAMNSRRLIRSPRRRGQESSEPRLHVIIRSPA